MSGHRHPDAPAWLPNTFCLRCNKPAETFSYISYDDPDFMWKRVVKARCHGETVERDGPTAFAPETPMTQHTRLKAVG